MSERTRVLILSMYASEEYVLQGLRAGCPDTAAAEWANGSGCSESSGEQQRELH